MYTHLALAPRLPMWAGRTNADRAKTAPARLARPDDLGGLRRGAGHKGDIAAAWDIADGRVRYEVTLPAGGTAVFDTTGRANLTYGDAPHHGTMTLTAGKHTIGFDAV